MLRHLKQFTKTETGSVMAEFAIGVGILLVILLGVVEFGLASVAKNSVASDAREGARYAVVHGATSGRVATTDSVARYVRSKTSLDSVRVITTWTPDKNPGSVVSVRVEHDTPRRGPFLPAHTDTSVSRMIILY